MRWLFFLYVRTDHDGGNKFLRRMQKILWGGDEARTNHASTRIEKGTMLTASARIDKCPTPGKGFLTNSSPPGPTRW